MILRKSTLINLLLTIFLVQISFVFGQEFAITEAQKDKNGIIYLTDDNFDKIFSLSQSHSFGLVLLFTTNTIEMGCKTCVDFNPEFDLIAKSWKLDHPDFVSNVDPDLKLFFGKAIVSSPIDIPNIFRLFKLQHIPKLFYFPPGADLSDFESFDIPHEGGHERINQVTKWIKRSAGINSETDFVIHQQIDWANVFVTCFLIFVSVYIFKKKYNLILKFVAFRWIWGLLSVIFILFMISGYMFTKMKQVPLAGADRNGDIIYFAENDFQNQFGIETQIVALFYGIMGVLMIALIKIIPTLDNASPENTDVSSSGSSNSNGKSRTDSVDYKSTRKFKKKNNNNSSIHMNPSYLSYILSIAAAILLYSFFAAFTHIYSMKQSYPFTFFKLTSLLGF